MPWQGLPLLPHLTLHFIHLLHIHPSSPLELFLTPLFLWRLIPVPFIRPYVMLRFLNSLCLWIAWLNIRASLHMLTGLLLGPFLIMYINSRPNTYVPRWSHFNELLNLSSCMKSYLWWTIWLDEDQIYIRMLHVFIVRPVLKLRIICGPVIPPPISIAVLDYTTSNLSFL